MRTHHVAILAVIALILIAPRVYIEDDGDPASGIYFEKDATGVIGNVGAPFRSVTGNEGGIEVDITTNNPLDPITSRWIALKKGIGLAPFFYEASGMGYYYNADASGQWDKDGEFFANFHFENAFIALGSCTDGTQDGESVTIDGDDTITTTVTPQECVDGGGYVNRAAELTEQNWNFNPVFYSFTGTPSGSVNAGDVLICDVSGSVIDAVSTVIGKCSTSGGYCTGISECPGAETCDTVTTGTMQIIERSTASSDVSLSGSINGLPGVLSDAVGNTCTAGACAGGTLSGEPCNDDADCPSSTCTSNGTVTLAALTSVSDRWRPFGYRVNVDGNLADFTWIVNPRTSEGVRLKESGHFIVGDNVSADPLVAMQVEGAGGARMIAKHKRDNSNSSHAALYLRTERTEVLNASAGKQTWSILVLSPVGHCDGGTSDGLPCSASAFAPTGGVTDAVCASGGGSCDSAHPSSPSMAGVSHGGIKIEDQTLENGNTYSLLIEPQDGDSQSAIDGNFNMIGGNWNNGHYRLGSPGIHIWYDETNNLLSGIEAQGGTAPTSETSGGIFFLADRETNAPASSGCDEASEAGQAEFVSGSAVATATAGFYLCMEWNDGASQQGWVRIGGP